MSHSHVLLHTVDNNNNKNWSANWKTIASQIPMCFLILKTNKQTNKQNQTTAVLTEKQQHHKMWHFLDRIKNTSKWDFKSLAVESHHSPQEEEMTSLMSFVYLFIYFCNVILSINIEITYDFLLQHINQWLCIWFTLETDHEWSFYIKISFLYYDQKVTI